MVIFYQNLIKLEIFGDISELSNLEYFTSEPIFPHMMIDIVAALSEGQAFKHLRAYWYRITKIGIEELHLPWHIMHL